MIIHRCCCCGGSTCLPVLSCPVSSQTHVSRHLTKLRSCPLTAQVRWSRSSCRTAAHTALRCLLAATWTVAMLVQY